MKPFTNQAKSFQNMLAQAQQMQKKIAEMQKTLEGLTFEGMAANGAVKVTLSGKGDCQQVKIDPSVVDADDVETLEDLVTLAFQDAQRQLTEKNNELQKGLNIPAF